MNVNIEITGIKELMETLNAKVIQAAANSAINKVADQAKTAASRQIRQEYNIKASDLSNNLRVTTRSSGSRLEAIITGFKRGAALSMFGAKQIGVSLSKKAFRYTRKATDGRGGAVSVEVIRGQRKTLSGDPKPFMTRFKSGHVAVMQREGKSRLPVKQLLGPGIAHLLGSRKIMDGIRKTVNQKFDQIFKHELEWRLKK